MRSFWLVSHVLAAIFALGPEIAFGMMGPRARRGGSSVAVPIYDAIAVARARIVYPALAVQLASGMALVEIVGRRIMREGWMSAALGLYTVAIALVALVLAPGSKRARRAMRSGVEPSDPSLLRLWKRQAIAGGIAGVFLIAVAVLMVWKPGR